MKPRFGALIKAILLGFQRNPDERDIARNSGPASQAHDAFGEDGGNLGQALFGGHVGGIRWIVGEGHQRSFVRGDARNDLRLATGAMPGNWTLETGTPPIPTSLIDRIPL